MRPHCEAGAITTDGTDGPTTAPKAGDTFTHERTFTVEEVREFGQFTGDDQSRHTDTHEEGRLVVQGLLTAAMVTKIGGDLGYLARTMEYEFRKPVYTGETVTCGVTVASVTERSDRYLLDNDVVYRNEDGAVVVEASTSGLIWKDKTG